MTLLIKIKTPVNYHERKTSKYFVLGLSIVLVSSSFFFLSNTPQNPVADAVGAVHSNEHTELQFLNPRESLTASTQ